MAGPTLLLLVATMIRRKGSKPTTRYWFENAKDDFWNDELDLRFVIPGLAVMALSLPLFFLAPQGWLRVVLLGSFFASFAVVGKRKGRWW